MRTSGNLSAVRPRFFLKALSLAAGVILAPVTLGSETAAASGREAVIARMQMRSLSTWHYAPPAFDDAYSRRVFDLYLKRLDPQKRFFLQADVASLRRFRDSLDDYLKRGDDAFSEAAHALLRRRVEESRLLAGRLLKAGLRLQEEDALPVEPEKQPYSRTSKELRARWTRLLKYQVLLRLEDRSEEAAKQDSLDSGKTVKKPAAIPGKAEIRAATDYVARNLERSLSRMLREERLDRTAAFLNAAANALDPHTEYFKPEARDEFNLSLSGTLEGIGAVLREDDGYIKVVSIVPGSAAWRQKELKAEDRILKVAQAGEEPVDLVDASVQEAVRLIRGKKGSRVRLTVEKPSGQVAVITIVRDVVVVEEAYAKSAVLQPGGTQRKFGYVALPSFYHDFANPDGRSSSADVRKEIERLKAKGVAGIILDLRGNDGGTLEDAVKMAGLFLPGGPVVQVKDRRGAENVLDDADPAVQYAGPLVILVNTFSASASEILAAAMQDYGRAVVVGSDTSFGKGTVQTLVDLDNFVAPSDAGLKPLGSLKLTVQKFYRVNGGSTQFRGVIPDILLPDGYTYLQIGEKSLENAISWDTVQALDFSRWSPTLETSLRDFQVKSRERVTASAYFKKVEEFLARQESFRQRKSMPLQLKAFFAEREKSRRESGALEALQKQATDMEVEPLATANSAAASDSAEVEKVKAWKEQLARDFYLREAANVLADLVGIYTAKR